MIEWWNGLALETQVYYAIAIFATVFLLGQTVLMFFGIGNAHVDADVDCGHAECDMGDGFAIFTVRGLVAFFTMLGWTGVLFTQLNMPLWLSILLSIVCGTIALFVVALLLKSLTLMQSSGTVDIAKAVGKKAIVYITIRSGGAMGGKVTLTLQGKFMELEAVTDDPNDYIVGGEVEVVGIRQDSLVVTSVKKINTAQS